MAMHPTQSWTTQNGSKQEEAKEKGRSCRETKKGNLKVLGSGQERLLVYGIVILCILSLLLKFVGFLILMGPWGWW